jgi:hypothetical protein
MFPMEQAENVPVEPLVLEGAMMFWSPLLQIEVEAGQHESSILHPDAQS